MAIYESSVSIYKEVYSPNSGIVEIGVVDKLAFKSLKQVYSHLVQLQSVLDPVKKVKWSVIYLYQVINLW